MLINLTMFFLGVSIVFYCLLGGADFGAGILELFANRHGEKNVSEVIGPVWEANHIWLILAVVILFMGFPRIYSTISLYLHIPIVLLLIGIIMRGTAFTFMHYDAIKGRSTRAYQRVFQLSSVITPFIIGISVGSLILGRINTGAPTYYEAFIAPWFNGFSFSVGLFCLALFSFLAAVFMIGEAEDQQETAMYISVARKAQVVTVLAGGLVFVMAHWYGVALVASFWNSWIALGCIVIATFSLGFLWTALESGRKWTPRFIAGFQLSLVLFAWFWIQHPVVIHMQNSADITFLNAAAPEATLIQLIIALAIGSTLILPGLWFLYKTFKTA